VSAAIRWAGAIAMVAAAGLWLASGSAPPGSDPPEAPVAALSELVLEPGETREIPAASLPSEAPLVLTLVLPVPSGAAVLSARVVASDGRAVESQAAVRGDDPRRAQMAVPTAWLEPGRYLVEVRTDETSHFPLRRYALEIR
jgi:hypothetical protein